MPELTMLDLPYYVSQIGGTLNNAMLVGVLVGEIEKPPHLEPVTVRDKNDRYAVIDLVGVITSTGKYFARGRVLAILNKNIIELAKGKDSGRIALILYGGSVRIVDSKRGHVNDFIQMMRWSKGDYNTWQIGHVDATRLRKEDHPEFYTVIANAYRNNWNFTYPVNVPSGYIDACQGYEFTFVDGNVINNPPKPQIPESKERVVSPSALGGLGTENLGVSTSSDIKTLVDNKSLYNRGVQEKPKFVVKNRENLEPYSENAKKMEIFISESDQKVAKILEKLSEITNEENSIEGALRFTAKQIKSSWHRTVGEYTGRALFKEAIERSLPEFDKKTASGSSTIADTLNIINTALVDNWVDFDYEEFNDNKFIRAVYESRISIYLKVLEILLGIKDRLAGVYTSAEAFDIDMLTLIKQNPYSLCYIDPRIGISDLDKLAMMSGVNLNDSEVKRARNVAYMHNYMLDSTNVVVGDNTVVKYGDLISKVRAGFILNKRDYDNLQIDGTAIQKDRIEALSFFIDDNINESSFKLPKEGWVKGFNKYILSNNQIADDLIKDYTASGLGIEMDLNGDKWVSDFIFAKKEMYIYNRLRELCGFTKRNKKITDAQIEKYINEFEKLKAKEFGLPEGGFKLEERQRQAGYLIKNPVVCLTGPAGSGKTTTAELLVYLAEHCLKVDSDEIMFCAPTGKAANRLKEVVKRPTRTINSLFGVGGEGLSLKDPEDVEKKEDISLLIVDESSMPNVNLMYEMILRIEDGTGIFFLGDIEQLPPIGFGKPFATMLTFLPTVVLNVTKRASDNSGITRNAKKLIYESDGVLEDLEDFDDYRIIHDKDANKVVDATLSIVRYHLGQGGAEGFTPVSNLGQDLEPDDIQIITPVNNHVWGTVQLNKVLQDIFNKRKQGEPVVLVSRGPNTKIEFRMNDRVMHIRENDSGRIRLRNVGENAFVPEKSKGIANGDVGKVVSFIKGKNLDFSQCEKDSDKEKLETLYAGTDNTYFLVVEYKDMDEETGDSISFNVLYRSEMVNKAGSFIDVVSQDLSYLDLAYALTVHKLQGSQSKLTIVLMLPVGFGSFASNFLSRNMLYTATTRAQVANYLLGDILGRNSCVNKGRKIEQTSIRLANIDNFY